jgi:hypothetical protein
VSTAAPACPPATSTWSTDGHLCRVTWEQCFINRYNWCQFRRQCGHVLATGRSHGGVLAEFGCADLGQVIEIRQAGIDERLEGDTTLAGPVGRLLSRLQIRGELLEALSKLVARGALFAWLSGSDQ